MWYPRLDFIMHREHALDVRSHTSNSGMRARFEHRYGRRGIHRPLAHNQESVTDADHLKERIMAGPTITALMHANLLRGLRPARSGALRREAIARTYTDDVAFTDDAGTVVGLAAIGDRVQQLLKDAAASVPPSPPTGSSTLAKTRPRWPGAWTARRRAGRTRSRHRDP